MCLYRYPRYGLLRPQWVKSDHNFSVKYTLTFGLPLPLWKWFWYFLSLTTDTCAEKNELAQFVFDLRSIFWMVNLPAFCLFFILCMYRVYNINSDAFVWTEAKSQYNSISTRTTKGPFTLWKRWNGLHTNRYRYHKNHCLRNKIVGMDRIGLGSIINMIWNEYGSVYTVLREGSVTVRARENHSWLWKARWDRYPKTLLAFTRGKGNWEVGTEPIFIRSVPEKDRNRLRSFSGTDRERMERIKFDLH